MWEQALLHTYHEHDRELQTLRLVQRDEGDGVGPVLHAVHVGDEADALEEGGERFRSAEVQVVAGGCTELLDILHALFAALLIEQPALVAAALKHCVYDVQQV